LGKDRPDRLLDCHARRAQFSEREGTPLDRVHLPEGKVLSIREHIAAGCGVLKTAWPINSGFVPGFKDFAFSYSWG
jgi:hypothetical protein